MFLPCPQDSGKPTVRRGARFESNVDERARSPNSRAVAVLTPVRQD